MRRFSDSPVRCKVPAVRTWLPEVCVISACLAAIALGAAAQNTQKPSNPANIPRSDTASIAPCDTAGQREITVVCEYVPAAESESPRIVINRISLSFKPKDESHMTVELTFTNVGSAAFTEARTVYLAMDDTTGQNHVRRPLPQVDFRQLEPGKAVTFTEHILMPAFQPGHYIINLWIPSIEQSLKFDPAHNLLLANDNVPNKKTGLNQLATFTVR